MDFEFSVKYDHAVVERYYGRSTDVIIPVQYNGFPVTEIADYCFYNSKITSVVGKSIKSVGYHAFRDCSSLTEINLPVCTSIYKYAFKGCESLIKKGKYKATNIDLTCRDFHYEIDKWFEENEALLCKKGFHYVENLYDIFNYYCGELGEDLRIFEIKADEISGERREDSKRVCKKIKLVKEIKSYQEILKK